MSAQEFIWRPAGSHRVRVGVGRARRLVGMGERVSPNPFAQGAVGHLIATDPVHAAQATPWVDGRCLPHDPEIANEPLIVRPAEGVFVEGDSTDRWGRPRVA